MANTKETALHIAQSIAEQEGWPWREPVSVRKRRQFLILGDWRWYIRTNVSSRGGNVWITIDDQSGNIVEKGFLPR